MDRWPARTKWTLEYFEAEFGDAMIEVSADRASDERYEDNFSLHRRELTMGSSSS